MGNPVIPPTNTATPPPPAIQPTDDQQPSSQMPSMPLSDQPTAPSVAAAPQTVGDRTKHVLGDIFQTLAGGQKIVYQQTPNGPVKTYQDLKPGEMARGILAAAITGLAGGYDPANRGKGPAMSAAFSGGFKAEQKARTEAQDQAEEEAQKQFQNKQKQEQLNMQESELTLRQHADAREQLESAVRVQKMQSDIDIAKQQAAEHKLEFDNGQLDRYNKQIADYTAAVGEGWKPVMVNGKPLADPDGYNFGKHASAFLKDIPHSDVANYKAVYDPNTNQMVVMEQPKGYDDKTMHFAKTDSKSPDGYAHYKEGDKIPEGYVVGDYIPNGDRGADGRMLKPTLMTGREAEGIIEAANEANLKKSTASEQFARAAILRQQFEENKETKGINDSLVKAGNSPFNVDTDTGLPFVSTTQRGLKINQLNAEAKTLQDGLAKARTQLENESDPDVKKQLQEEITINAAHYQRIENELGTFNGTPTKSQALSNSLIQRYTPEDGKFDYKKASDAFEKHIANYKAAGYDDQDLDRVRAQMLAKSQTPPPTAAKAEQKSAFEKPGSVDVVQAHINDLLKQGKTSAEVISEINNTQAFTAADKQQMIDYVKQQTTRAPAGAQTLKDIGQAAKEVVTNPGAVVPTSVPGIPIS